MSAWVLVLFLAWSPLLKSGIGAGVVAIDMPDFKTCEAGLERARKVDTFEDGFCVYRGPEGEKQ